MKERWRYSDLTKFDGGYVKILQRLTWRYFIRTTHTWFDPCKKCQEALDELFNKDKIRFLRQDPWELFDDLLCKNCKIRVVKAITDDDTIIMGNKDYEPRLELSRRWIDDDNSVFDVTKEEYRKSKGLKD